MPNRAHAETHTQTHTDRQGETGRGATGRTFDGSTDAPFVRTAKRTKTADAVWICTSAPTDMTVRLIHSVAAEAGLERRLRHLTHTTRAHSRLDACPT